MSTIKQRAIGAVVGSIVSDAAGAPIHWIYDTDKLQAILKDHSHPEFLPQTHCPFYHIPTGSNSGYGDQVVVLLRSMVENKGFNQASYANAVYAHFGPGTPYSIDHGEPRKMPIKGPWIHKSIKTFLQNYQEKKEKTGAKDDNQADGFAKMAPIAALYAGDPKMTEIAESVVRVTQECDEAVKYSLAAVRLLEDLILNGGTAADAARRLVNKDGLDQDVKHNIQRALNAHDQEHRDFVKQVGSSCALPKSFICSLHAIGTSDSDFLSSTRRFISGGGDNCSRSCFIGAALGAQVGFSRIPKEWIEKTGYKDIVELAETLVAMRESSV